MIFQQELTRSFEKHKENVAVIRGDEHITYEALDKMAGNVAAHLMQAALGPETIVGLLLRDRLHMVAAMIGVLKCRCAFVPVDGTLPAARLQAMIADLDLDHVITDQLQTSGMEGVSRPPNIYEWSDMMSRNTEEHGMPYPECQGEDSVYVYFTSGSTGAPKGIVGKNKSLLQFLQWEIETFEIGNGTRVSQLISPYFDAFLRDVFAPLLAGGTVCLAPEADDFFTPEKITTWLNENRIDLVHCVPSVFRVINHPLLSAADFPGLKYVLLSGERITPAELRNWYAVFNDRVQLVNFYGATETTMIRAWYRIRPEDANAARIPVGYPIHDTTLLVAKNDMQACNMLVPGDLFIISGFTAKGYLNAPELTNSAFIPVHVGTASEAIAFKTGDIARVLVDGKIDLIGRKDRQIKLRGIRIEPAEIENCMMQSGLVKHALVCRHTDEKGNESLAGFIIRHPAESKEAGLVDTVNSYIKDFLPSYMIPSQVVEVDEYPLLRTGKINFPELLKKLIVDEMVPPQNETEEVLLDIWRQLLGDKPISVTDSFTRTGGNSLSIMRLIGMIAKAFNTRISLSEMLNHLTIRKQAAYIMKTAGDGSMAISPAAEKAAYSLSSVQERMYYNFELNRNSTAYNLPMAWEIKGDYDRQAIEHAFNKLIERHEGLRTRFLVSNGGLAQAIEPRVSFTLEEQHDVDITRALSKFVRPFQLDRAPLFRAAILKDKDDKTVLATDIHHIVCDGLSQIILAEDFLRLYHGEDPGPLIIQLKDYAEWETQFKKTPAYLAQREFWLHHFDTEAPALNLPVTGSPTVLQAEEGRSLVFGIEAGLFNKMLSAMDDPDLSQFSTLLSIYFLFLAQLTGQEDIVVGVPVAGRMQADLERVAGMFVKTLPVRFKINVSSTFREMAQEMNRHLLQCYNNQAYDLSDIVRELSNRQNDAVKELFSVLFVFQNFDNKNIYKDHIVFTEYRIENKDAKYPLSIIVNRDEDRFYFRIEYSTIYFTDTDAGMLAEQFTQMVNTMAGNVHSKIIDFAGFGEQAASLEENNITFNL